MAAKRKVFLVDDHPVFRHGLAHLLNAEKDFIVCGEASDGPPALSAIPRLRPDLAVLEIAFNGMSGLDLTKALRAGFPALRILIFSAHPESLHAERALQAGANGYVMKRESLATVLAAARRVLEGKTYVSPELNERILQGFSGDAAPRGTPVERLSNRELEVFRLVGQGYGTRQIAEALSMSMKTVETHRLHIKEKLKLRSTFELVQRAIHWAHRENGAL